MPHTTQSLPVPRKGGELIEARSKQIDRIAICSGKWPRLVCGGQNLRFIAVCYKQDWYGCVNRVCRFKVAVIRVWSVYFLYNKLIFKMVYLMGIV